MEEFSRLWQNKKDSQGRIDITIFFINILLLLVHIFYMFVYIALNHYVMMYLNIASLFTYSIFLFECYKKPKFYLSVIAIEIWVHMLFAIMSFGWLTCFQNWSFALISAVFLPMYGEEDTEKVYNKRAYIYSLIVIISFFVFSVAVRFINLGIFMALDDMMLRTIFTANNFITFFSIIMVATFYTSTSKRKQDELTRKADFDELTNIYNRHAIQAISTVIINHAIQDEKPYHVAILDIDFFKNVNDEYGHPSGDLVLRRLASIIRQSSNKGVFCARWGGEEFVMLCSSAHDYKYFTDLLEKLRIKVSKTKFSIEDGSKINLHISIGSATIKDGLNLEEAVSIADDRLYTAKETGRNKLVSK